MSDEPKRVAVTAPKSRGGDWVPIGDEEYRIPPLGFLSLQELQEDIKSIADMGRMPTGEQMRTVARIVHAAMVRNYPELPETEVCEMLDMGNYQDVLGAVLSIAGFKRAEAGGPGEAVASIGASSTPA